jgi:prepilin-type N-terminal cleavage/methylation domain-containing protein
VFKLYYELQERRKAGESSESGFTLIELLIVIVVLGILAAIVIFSLTGVTGQSQVAACNSDAKTIETASSAYQAVTGSWPTTISQLTSTTQTADSPFLKSAPTATLAANGYVINSALAANGVPQIQTGTVAAPGANYDTANPCGAA